MVGIRILDTLLEAPVELLYCRDLHASDKAEVAVLELQGSGETGKEAALMLAQ